MYLNSRLALGTVQFGLDYGINNKQGQIKYQEIENILNFAFQNKITYLDTAEAYGNAEKQIGTFIKEHPEIQFKLISKYNFDGHTISAHSLKKSMNELCVDSIYGYLAHDFKKFKNNLKLIHEFIALKKSHNIQKIGFSLYYPSDLDFLIQNDIKFDLVQVPYNILDQRFAPYFKKLKDLNVEIHTRSCFLQGLFFMNPLALPVKLIPLQDKLVQLHAIASKNKLKINTLALAYCLENTFIHKVVIGVDSLLNLKDNLNDLKTKVDTQIIRDLDSLREENEQLILPSNW